MPKERRSLMDYDEDVNRFEKWVKWKTRGRVRTLDEFEDIDELKDALEVWLEAIEVPIVNLKGVRQRDKLANAMLDWMRKRELLIDELIKKPIVIKKTKKRRVVLRKGLKWRDEDIDYLKFRYKDRDVAVTSIAREMGRTAKAVYNKASKLKVRRLKIK